MRKAKRRLATKGFEIYTVDPPDLPSSLMGVRDDQDARNTSMNQGEAVVVKDLEEQNGFEKMVNLRNMVDLRGKMDLRWIKGK